MVNAATFWNKQAPSYFKSPIKDMDSYNATLARTRTYLKPTDNVLEIGAGTGSTALELAPMVKSINATDISPAMLEFGQQRADKAGMTNIRFTATDATIPDETGPYDVVLAHNILHLVDDLPTTLNRAYEVLQPGGIFISKTFCKPKGFGTPLYYLMMALLPIMQRIGKAPHVAVMTHEELDTAIAKAGFDIIEVDNGPKGEQRRYVVARKPN